MNSTGHLLASLLGASGTSSQTSGFSVFDPLYKAIAAVLAFFYSLVPNYAIAIALLTVAVMVVLFPLTWKSTRSMIQMQRLQPEMKKLQAKYKGDRERLNQEMMALYKDNNVNPMSGCLPMVIQFPVFWVLYRVIANLTHSVKVTKTTTSSVLQATATQLGKPVSDLQQGHTYCVPEHVSHSSTLYQHLLSSQVATTGSTAGCHMKSFGLDLAKSVGTVHGTLVIGYWILVGLVVLTQYIQTRQLNGRNPAAAANPQAKMMQRVMPVVFGFISISIPAGVNVYFLVSSLFRIGQQEFMYAYDPVLSAHAKSAPKAIDVPSRDAGTKPARPAGSSPGLGGALSRFLGLDQMAQGQRAAGTDGNGQKPAASGNGRPNGKGGAPPPARPANRNRSRKKSRRRR
ncbi:MAG TPA: YidC/Oxa1 family membrane protein insertase [Acidimicrobiales bacterium]|nr:YidC/Oxa1 family membrane protein insertase [Acidimicrobiales bacterium]